MNTYLNIIPNQHAIENELSSTKFQYFEYVEVRSVDSTYHANYFRYQINYRITDSLS